MHSWEHSLCSLFSSKNIAFSRYLCTAYCCREEGCFCGGLWFLWKRHKGLHSGVGFCSRNLFLGIIRGLLTSVCSVGCYTLQEVPLNDCFVFVVGNVLLDWVFWSLLLRTLLWGELEMLSTDSTRGCGVPNSATNTCEHLVVNVLLHTQPASCSPDPFHSWSWPNASNLWSWCTK